MTMDIRSRTQGFNLFRFAGPGGACLMINKRAPRLEGGHPQGYYTVARDLAVTREEALTLAKDLMDFANKAEVETIGCGDQIHVRCECSYCLPNFQIRDLMAKGKTYDEAVEGSQRETGKGGSK